MLVPQKYSISGELHLLTSQRYRTLATAGHGSSTYDPLPTWRLSPDPTVLCRQPLGFRADARGLALFWCNSFSWHVSFFTVTFIELTAGSHCMSIPRIPVRLWWRLNSVGFQWLYNVLLTPLPLLMSICVILLNLCCLTELKSGRKTMC